VRPLFDQQLNANVAVYIGLKGNGVRIACNTHTTKRRSRHCGVNSKTGIWAYVVAVYSSQANFIFDNIRCNPSASCIVSATGELGVRELGVSVHILSLGKLGVP